MCVNGLVSVWSTYCVIYSRCTILTELQIDKLLFIASGLGPYTCLKAFAQFTTRAEFHTYLINECTMAQERLSGILLDMSNLDDIANSHDWATAAAPREPKCRGTYWIECTSDSCFFTLQVHSCTCAAAMAARYAGTMYQVQQNGLL